MSELAEAEEMHAQAADPYGGWEEEDVKLDDVDLSNMPMSSQEAAEALLKEDISDNNISDTEHASFLEDVFAVPELIKEEDNIVELIDIACDVPRKSEEHSNEALNFISNPKNKKSAKTCKQCQTQCIKHCCDDNARIPDSKVNLVNYFSHIASSGKCGPGTMWCAHSCLRSHTML